LVPNAVAAAETRELVAPSTKAPSPRRQAQTTREIPFQSAATSPLSTFPLKPGNTSYPQVRKALQEGHLTHEAIALQYGISVEEVEKLTAAFR
jgi:hypothetical protein